MRLINGNVERVTEDPGQIAKLKADGFKELDSFQPAEREGKSVQKNLPEMNLTELKALAKARGLEGYSSLSKEELLSVLKDVV